MTVPAALEIATLRRALLLHEYRDDDGAWQGVWREEPDQKALAALDSLEARLRDTETALRGLLRWQPTTSWARGTLHPQHLAAIQAAEDALPPDPPEPAA